MIHEKFVHEFCWWNGHLCDSLNRLTPTVQIYLIALLVGSVKCASTYQWVSILALSINVLTYRQMANS